MPAEQLITIFEGPDGSGKSTAAKNYALRTNAHYVHMGPLKHVTTGLSRLYVEAMLPALLGYQSVVMDRCWLSEPIYGQAFRGGADRQQFEDRKMLERLAMRCGAVVVLCLPPFSQVLQTWKRRQSEEMLERQSQLKKVYDLYSVMKTDLYAQKHDYTTTGSFDSVNIARMPCHPLEARTAGNYHADIILVGDEFADVKNDDALYQWPFASFSGVGCSRWLTFQIHTAATEADLMWVNIDQVTREMAKRWVGRKVVALGDKALNALHEMLGPDDGVDLYSVQHPQAWKRFKGSETYPLPNLIHALLTKKDIPYDAVQ